MNAHSGKKEKPGIKWRAEVLSSKHHGEKLVWDGVVSGNVLPGKMAWVKNFKTTSFAVEAKEK